MRSRNKAKFKPEVACQGAHMRSAMVSKTSEREKLAKVCSRINLTPPVTKKANNEQQKQAKDAAADNTLEIMLMHALSCDELKLKRNFSRLCKMKTGKMLQ